MSDEISRAGAEEKDAGVLEEVSVEHPVAAGAAPSPPPPAGPAPDAGSAGDGPGADPEDAADPDAGDADPDAVAGRGPIDPVPADPGPEVPSFPEDPSPEDLERLTSVLLAVLFATEDPLAIARLAHAAGASSALARRGLDALAARIAEQRLPFELLESGGAFRVVTHPDYHPHILRLRAVRKNERLSPAALETLAIIAYRQPIIRAEIEAIRGVKAGPLLRTLMDKKLVRVAGRSEVPGRPILYGTTREFLDRFGITSPKDLPSLGELKLGQV